MITRCPACDTHFRVHADQLAARSGQVRCGKCAKVFNALDHLAEEAMPEYETGVAQAQRVEPVSHAAAESPSNLPPREPAGDEMAGVDAPLPQAEEAEPARAGMETAPPGAHFDFGPATTARQRRIWPWLLGALSLLVVLAAQAAFHYRTAITLLIPETKPWFLELCATLHCEIPLPRRIDLMSIEASDLQADTNNPNVMVLSATLKNRAVFSQQYPMIELTLTDEQEQPVVRRVLAPQDYMGRAVNAQAGLAANAEVAVKVFVEGSQIKATGYRLYLFYP